MTQRDGDAVIRMLRIALVLIADYYVRTRDLAGCDVFARELTSIMDGKPLASSFERLGWLASTVGLLSPREYGELVTLLEMHEADSEGNLGFAKPVGNYQAPGNLPDDAHTNGLLAGAIPEDPSGGAPPGAVPIKDGAFWLTN